MIKPTIYTEQANLSKKAETALLEAIQTQKHGDAFYFWVRMDQDERNLASQDFWSFCDAINAGNCRSAVLKAFQRMYGVQLDDDLHTLPLMPNDGDTWSVMQSWVLPTRSFLEFVMFSRCTLSLLEFNSQHSSIKWKMSLANCWCIHFKAQVHQHCY
jgi:hypothetical protein